MEDSERDKPDAAEAEDDLELDASETEGLVGGTGGNAPRGGIAPPAG